MATGRGGEDTARREAPSVWLLLWNLNRFLGLFGPCGPLVAIEAVIWIGMHVIPWRGVRK